MTVKEYMIPVYGLLVKTGKREIESIPGVYQILVAEYLVSQVEGE
ncbi:CD1375 family protein [Tissierella praeacuta]